MTDNIGLGNVPTVGGAAAQPIENTDVTPNVPPVEGTPKEGEPIEVEDNDDVVIPEVPKTTFGKPGEDDLTPEEPEEPENITGDNPDEVFYKGVADILSKKEFFTNSELGEIKSEDDFAAALDAEIQARMDERYKEIQEYMNAGVDYSRMSQLNQGLNTLNSITNEHITNDADLVKELIVGDFLERGFSQDDAVKYYNMIEKNGDTQEEAIKALANRKTLFQNAIEQEKQAAQNQQLALQQKRETELKNFNKALEADTILGRKVTSATTEKLKKLVTEPVAYTQNNQPLTALMKYQMENPIDYEVAVSYLYMVTDGFKNLKAFDRSAETRVSNNLRTVVNTMSTSESPIIKGSDAKSHAVKAIDVNSIDDIV